MTGPSCLQQLRTLCVRFYYEWVFFKKEKWKHSSQEDPSGPLLTTAPYLFQGNSSIFFLECGFIPLRKVVHLICVCEKGGLTQWPWVQ